MHDYLKMAHVTNATKIIDTHRNDNSSDVEDLDFIDLHENIEISLEEEIFDEKSDPEDITIIDIEEQVVEKSVQLERLLRVIFNNENDIRHVVTDPDASSIEISNQKSVEGVIYKCIHCLKSYKKKSFYLLQEQNCFKRITGYFWFFVLT